METTSACPLGFDVVDGRELVLPDRVTLRNGETLQLERGSDLGNLNAGILIYVDGGEHPEYLPWTEVARIDFD